ncbi:hypothetical protein GH714_004610 [Hevea brasiliensis]|uniref:Uncharacterized protein n=1 Tax=Hevea brasiliensis TaxID=3981 RepID=A0A6A6LCY6_HEVBR|nr:hypothetical protein GH714_004610 [Hevea brasiliensis]
MTGMAIPPVLAGAGLTVGAGPAVGTGQKMSVSIANFLRIADVAKRLATHLQPGSAKNPTEFFRLCLFLARGIDYAVANNEVPSKALDLPLLLKQVCLCKNDHFLEAAIMVLMISVKNACKIGWFSDKDSQELFTLANEIGNSFCSRDVNTVLSDYLSIISTVMSRFYPLMKMGQILASLEVKWLFVVQGDNTEASACIISPQHVNFLLNGKGVEGRTTVSMDTGPQIPTNVTTMLKYGTNLFKQLASSMVCLGHYIIAVVFMSVTPLPETPVLLDYVESDVAAADPDSDIIEGPSCVSLNCPIRYSMVLKEVGENVADVIISADGSWKAILEGDDNADQTSKGTVNCQKETIGQQEPTTFSNALPLSQLVNAAVNESGRLMQIPRHVNRAPIAVQALPVPSQTSIQQQSCKIRDPYKSTSSVGQDFTLIAASLNSTEFTSASSFSDAPTQESISKRRSINFSPSTKLTQQRIAQVGAGNTAGFPNSQHSRFTAAAQLAVQMARQPPSVPVQIPTSRGTSYLNTDGTRAPAMMQGGNVGAAALANTGTDGGLNLSSEQNWRPSGRMRGSLSGQAATAYGDLIIQPTQPAPAPAPAPQPRVTSALPSVPPPMQAFLANSRNVTQAQSSTEPASVNGNLRTLT